MMRGVRDCDGGGGGRAHGGADRRKIAREQQAPMQEAVAGRLFEQLALLCVSHLQVLTDLLSQG
ncbi:MAG: hypothetical protein FWD12_16055 [Alphaproteobacteria bacterium]|nr:hypothetical protein [Alphaproteobacteria bacterium]